MPEFPFRRWQPPHPGGDALTHIVGRERNAEVALGALPGGNGPLQGRPLAREGSERLLASHGRDAELLQCVENRADGLECVRHPDGVHIHGEPAPSIARAAVAPARRDPGAVRGAREAHEVHRDGVAGVRCRLPRDERQIGNQSAQTTLDLQEAALPIRRHSRVGEKAGGHHRQLEVVVHHDVVLARGRELPEPHAGAREPTRRYQAVVLGGVLADRLAAQGLLVAHVPGGRQLTEGARDDVLRHGRRPHGLHEQGGHEHVATEIGREVRQPRHQLLTVAKQLDAPHFALEPSEAQRVGRVGADLGGEAMEFLVEDLRPREGRQRRRVRRHPHAHTHRASGRTSNSDGAAGERRHGFPSVALEREPEVILTVEAHLLDLDRPGRVRPHPPSPSPRCGEGERGSENDVGREPGAQHVDRLRADERQVTRPLRRL